MKEKGKNFFDCLPLVMLNMHTTTGKEGLSPVEILYDRPYTVPQLKPFVRDDEEPDECLADYMKQQLIKQEVFSHLLPRSPGDQPTGKTESVTWRVGIHQSDQEEVVRPKVGGIIPSPFNNTHGSENSRTTVVDTSLTLQEGSNMKRLL